MSTESIAQHSGQNQRSSTLALYSLTLGAFAIGMTEFVIMGLLREVASDLNVSTPMAGFLITGYALGVAISAPIITLATNKMPRKALLLFLMILFIAGNALAAVAPNYSVLMLARIVAALTHGSFFGVGSVIAAGLVPKEKRAGAIAIMFIGLTLANILGVPFGTFLGQAYGWRSTFGTIAVIGIIALLGLIFLVPKVANQTNKLRQELAVVKRPTVLVALMMTVFGYGGVFTAFTYISPILVEITGFASNAVPWILVLFGVGITIGNVYGGKLADRKLLPSLLGILIFLTVILAVFSFTDQYKILTLITVFLFGIAAFGTVPGLQVHVLNTAKEAPTLASTLNIAAFNLGNAIGAYVGGLTIDLKIGGGLPTVTWTAALVTIIGVLFTIWAMQQQRKRLN
ncbi:MFS transporter, DHA1 family, inner membrane transport protein [Marininema mesophilum]|uniref:MFS transporter, DHA1 family, inner membrane transport protein n=1 Tax=Marininema mesophilum TaxID=1048340 RepID=A0A1H2RW14_9BACL|nr:MFS transporter [Marininema mesophilum]SDW23485.1 MFS transporter, DHA1 family, inner membrane transport protein [Marininema mesophilum]